MVHRVDGPIRTYRGFDDGSDARIVAINRELAAATVFQSRYSLQQHAAEGLELAAPVVIPNAPDPAIFHPPPERSPLAGRRLRIVTTSWSTNPARGADALRWLDRHLDTDRFEMTYVGRSELELERITLVEPLPSHGVAEQLRAHDVFFTASRHEACSNALLEGLACGLPALYVRSGSTGSSSARRVSASTRPRSCPPRSSHRRPVRRAPGPAIEIPSLAEVADRYAEVLGL